MGKTQENKSAEMRRTQSRARMQSLIKIYAGTAGKNLRLLLTIRMWVLMGTNVGINAWIHNPYELKMLPLIFEYTFSHFREQIISSNQQAKFC